MQAIERTGEFRGLYHVLHGALAPMKGVGPEELRLSQLVERLNEGSVREVIAATGASTEGEATALYLGKLLSPMGLTVSRIAQGLPAGTPLHTALRLGNGQRP